MSAGSIKAVNAFVSITVDSKELAKGLKSARAKMVSFANSAKQIGASFLGVGAAITGPFALAAKQFADFEQQMKIVGAVAQATGEDFMRLTEAAKQLGLTTTFTAREAGVAMEVLGRAGFDTAEILKTVPSVLQLSRATATELGEAARIAAATLRVFGLEANNINESKRVVDVLAATSVRSAQTVEGLGEGLKFVGPFAKQAGLSLEKTAAVLGVLADNGIRGTVAGTGFARILKNLSQGAKIKVLDDLNISVDDSLGNMREITDVLGELFKATERSGSTERLSIFEDLFGRGAAAALVIAESTEKINMATEASKEFDDTAKNMAQTMDNALAGSFRLAESAATGLAIAVGEAITPALRAALSVFRSFAKLITAIVELTGPIPTTFIALAGATTLLLGGMTLLVGVMTGFAANVTALLPLVTALGVKFGVVSVTAAKAATGIAAVNLSLTVMWKLLSPLLIVFAELAVILAAFAVAGYMAALLLEIMETRKETEKLNAATQKAFNSMEKLSKQTGTGIFTTMEKANKTAREYAMNIAKAGAGQAKIVAKLKESAKINEDVVASMRRRLASGEDISEAEQKFIRGEINEREKMAKALSDMAQRFSDQGFVQQFAQELEEIRKKEGIATRSLLQEQEERKKARQEELRLLKEQKKAQEELNKAQREAAMDAGRALSDRAAARTQAERDLMLEREGAADPQALTNRLEQELQRASSEVEEFADNFQRLAEQTVSKEGLEELEDRFEDLLSEEERLQRELMDANKKLIASRKRAVKLQESVEEFLMDRLDDVASRELQEEFERQLDLNPQQAADEQEKLLRIVEENFNALAEAAERAAKKYEDTGRAEDLERAKQAFEDLKLEADELDRIRDFRDRARDAIANIDEEAVGTFSLAQARALSSRTEDKIPKEQLKVQQEQLREQKKQTDELKRIQVGWQN